MELVPFKCNLPAIWILISALFSLPAHALKGINPDGSLDKAVVSKAYFEGEFWTVINALEEFRKGNLKNSPRDDSVYTFKYLSVVYAAEPATRAKAESYMYMLLKMMPTIDLLDLYISDNIESVFKKVRNDFERMNKLGQSEAPPVPEGQATADQPPKGEKNQIASGKPSDSKNLVIADANPKENPSGTAKGNSAGTEPKSERIRPWVWFSIGGGTLASVATYFLVVDASSHKSKPANPTWDVQVTPSP